MGIGISERFPEIKDVNYERAYNYMGLTPGGSPYDIPLKHVFIGSCTCLLYTSLFEEYYTNIDSKQIYPTSKLVSLLTGVATQPNKAIVGAKDVYKRQGKGFRIKLLVKKY